MKTITAAEMRAITNEQLAGPAIEVFVEWLNKKIRESAELGSTSLDPHAKFLFRGSPSPAPRTDQWRAIETHYRSQGFQWVDYPSPDPGHPASRPYTILSW